MSFIYLFSPTCYIYIYIYIYVILKCLSWNLPREEVHFWRLGNFLLAIYIYSPWDSRKVLGTKRILEKCNSFFKLVQPTLMEKKSPPNSGLKSGSLNIAHKLLAHTHSRRIWDGQDTSTTFFSSLFLFLLNYFNFLFKNWIIGCERIWFLNVFVGNIKKYASWLRYIRISLCKKFCFVYFNIRISFFYFIYSLFKTAYIKLSILYYISLKCKIFMIFF